MRAFELKPTHKPDKTYYAAVDQFDDHGVSHEGAMKPAFRSLSVSNGEMARVGCRFPAAWRRRKLRQT